ncbi:MAG TPA: hypothetical protein VGO58_08655 [Chitinophagaceae bacterium]|jgi:uncharacterized protein involved in exopolysaccharide biosynthesis|nr:hypothetical protein [Chitinophagaceae bacterium]
MPDLAELIKHGWKQIAGAMILSLLVVGVITFLTPPQYLSVATAVPASSYAADRSAIFNENIQALYSTLGTADDLDRIVGTAELDTVYLAVADEFNLFDHYKIRQSNSSRLKAAKELKANTSVTKSGYGELKVKAWDTDKSLAPQLANAILSKLEAIHRDLQSAGNEATLNSLIKQKDHLQLTIDSSSGSPERNPEFHERIKQYEKLIGEYQVMISSKPPSLIVVEKARMAESPDRPKRMYIMIATAVLSFLFSLLLALLMYKRKNVRP